jgi:hypothetical protein
MYNSEKLATAAIQNVQFRETGNNSNTKCTIQRNWQQQQYKMYNSEKLATAAIQNVQFRETDNSSNTKCTIQRNWQHMVHKTKKNKTKIQHNMC